MEEKVLEIIKIYLDKKVQIEDLFKSKKNLDNDIIKLQKEKEAHVEALNLNHEILNESLEKVKKASLELYSEIKDSFIGYYVSLLQKNDEEISKINEEYEIKINEARATLLAIEESDYKKIEEFSKVKKECLAALLPIKSELTLENERILDLFNENVVKQRNLGLSNSSENYKKLLDENKIISEKAYNVRKLRKMVEEYILELQKSNEEIFKVETEIKTDKEIATLPTEVIIENQTVGLDESLNVEKPVEEKVEEAKEEPTEEKAEETKEEPTEEKVEEIKEEPVEEKAEEIKEEPVEEKAEEIKEEPVEEKIEEVKEESVEETTGEVKENLDDEKEEIKLEEPIEEVKEESSSDTVSTILLYDPDYDKASFPEYTQNTQKGGSILLEVDDPDSEEKVEEIKEEPVEEKQSLDLDELLKELFGNDKSKSQESKEKIEEENEEESKTDSSTEENEEKGEEGSLTGEFSAEENEEESKTDSLIGEFSVIDSDEDHALIDDEVEEDPELVSHANGDSIQITELPKVSYHFASGVTTIDDEKALLQLVYENIIDSDASIRRLRLDGSKEYLNESERYIYYKGPNQQYRLAGSVDLDLETKIQLPNGEYINLDEFIDATQRYIKTIEGQKFIIEKTDEVFTVDISGIDTLKGSLKKCSLINILKAKRFFSSSENKIYGLSRKKVSKKRSKGQISYSTTIPQGSYVSKIETLLALKNMLKKSYIDENSNVDTDVEETEYQKTL